MKYSEDETKFLIDNYSNYGSSYCADILKRSPTSIRHKASRLGLKISDLTKSRIQKKNSNKRGHISTTDKKLDLNSFLNCKTKEVAYILGLLWADGYICTSGYNNGIKLEVNYNDCLEFFKIFNATGKWNILSRTRSNRKKQGLIHINNKRLATHLINNGYAPKNKDLNLASKLIPNKFKSYWLLGIIDGDGCWYPPQKQFSITGWFNQDWSEIEDILDSLNIKYSIKNRVYSKNKYSVLRVCGRKNLKKIGEYVYQDSKFTSLVRKKNKYLMAVSTD